MTNLESAAAGESEFHLSRSMVFPLVGGRSTWKQEHLVPIIATILVSLAMMVLQPAAPGADQIKQAWVIYWIIALYIALVVNTYIYHMCERAAAWWLIVGVAAFTFFLLGSPFWHFWYALFNGIPSQQWQKSSHDVVQFAGWYVVGLREELFKALPLFALILLGAGLAFLGRRAPGRLGKMLAGLAKHIGISGPLNGIILGVASGTGFFLMETLGQYVPQEMSRATGAGTQAFGGLVLLLARGLPTLTGHCAYSGLFGYFIGLSVRRPKMATYLLLVGYLSAAALHGGWDAISTVSHNGFVILGLYIFVALLSYALLAGAMFKAREIPVAGAQEARSNNPALQRDVTTNQTSAATGESEFHLSRGMVFPLVGGRSTWKQEHLVPIIATILVSLAMMVLQPETGVTAGDQLQQAWLIYWIVALYIALMINVYIYHMCARAAPWWLIVGVAAFTFLLLGGPSHIGGSFWHYWSYFFYLVIPGQSLEHSSNPIAIVAGNIFGTGLCEEGLKAIPLFVLILLGAGLTFLGRHAPGRLGSVLAFLAKHIRISGPLSGIILGVASGTGFFLKETMQEYVPRHMSAATTDTGTQAFSGLVYLLSRALPTLTCHSAYAGLFGYFIGLSVLRPKMAIYLLPVGWLSAAALHGAWDASDGVFNNVYVLLGLFLFLALLGYALLGGAMFKAREIPIAHA